MSKPGQDEKEAATLGSRVERLLSPDYKKQYLVEVIEAIELVIKNKASDSHLELEISSTGKGSRKIKEIPIQELIILHDKLIGQLRDLDLKEKNKYPKNVSFRFG